MSWFARGSATADRPGIDWAVDPIPPSQWARHAAAYPSSIAVVDEAVQASGLQPAEIDRVEAVAGVWKLIVEVGQKLLASDPGAVSALETVWGRSDLTDDLLWNFFTHHGAQGIAARNHLIESVFHSGEALGVLVQLMREGSFRHAVGGSDRI